MARVMTPRKARTATPAARKKAFTAEVATVGPFVVLFSANQKQKKDKDGKGIKGENIATGELNICVQVPSEEGSDRFNVRLQYGPDLRGALGTIVDNWDAFQEACAVASEAHANDETYNAVKTRLAAYLAANGPDAANETDETETDETQPAEEPKEPKEPEEPKELDPSLVTGLVNGHSK